MKPQIQAILFDLDGTLIDTEPSAAKAVQDCFSQWKIQIHPHDIGYFTGRTWESAFTYLMSRYPIPVTHSEAKKLILDRYHQSLETDLVEVSGATQAVKSLANRFPLGLVSGSWRKQIIWALDRLQIKHHFQVILGAEDYAQSKPEPDGYLKATQILKLPISSYLVFEDSTAGIQSARSAGLWVIGVTGTNHHQQDLSLAHHKIHDLTQVNDQWIEHLSFD